MTASGDPADPSPERPGRPGAGAPVRPRAQRLGARRRLDPDPPPRPPRALVPAPGPHARGDAREVRRGPRRLRVRRPAARRDRARHRSLGRPARRTRPTSARSWPSPRRSPAPTRCSRRRRCRSPASTRSSACASWAAGQGGLMTATVQVDPGGRSGELSPERAARPARLVRAATAPRGAARRDLHRVLGDLLPDAAVTPSTGTFYRAVFGLPLLVLVAFGERRRHGPLPARVDPAGRARRASSSPAT